MPPDRSHFRRAAPIANQADLQAALRQFTPGQRTSLTYLRDNTRHTVQMTLADYPVR